MARICIENSVNVKDVIEVGQAEFDTAISRIKYRESGEQVHKKRRIGFCTEVNQ